MAEQPLVDRHNKTLMLPFDKSVASIIHEHKVVGGRMVLPHTHDVVRLLRNMGHKAPAPIMVQYDWNNDKPFKTQKVTAAMLTMNRRAYVLSEMGTGKTRAALHALNFMLQEGVIRKALIVAPLSTLTTVWEKEIFRYFNHLSTGVLHGTRAKRLEVLNDGADVFIINHDGIKSIHKELLTYDGIDAVVIDELASFRNARTDRWKYLAALVKSSKYAWGMTGSPTPNEPADAWGQCRMLTPDTVPKFYKTFKQHTMVQVSQFTWVPRKDARDRVYEVMQPAVRFKRDDCVELPPVVYQQRDVPLSKTQSVAYDAMLKKMKIMFAAGEVTAANEGVLMSKLLQITTGFVYTKDKKVVTLDNTPRMEALQELIDEADGKVIVFVDFVHASKEVAAGLKFAGYSVEQVSGETSKKDRDQVFAAFQSAMQPRVLVAHPKCMSHGLTLTAADTIVWFSPTTSLETYEQACARITRPGQVRKQLIVNLTGTSVESRLYRRLEKKAKTQGALLELFE
jgi:SNF2 family DNA or RNA helicase